MANNFFDLVKDNFFIPLTGKNRRLNYDILYLIYSNVSLDNLVLYKDQIVEWIVDYLEKCPIVLIDDEDDKEETDTSTYAYNKIRYFTRYGWLDADTDGLQVTYQINDAAVKLIKLMNDMVIEDEKPIEFSGYVYSIYSGLCDNNTDRSVAITEQIYKSSRELNATLLGLNNSIKNFLTKLLNNNEATPREILKVLLHDYQKKIILKAFKNFREKDNPAKFKAGIITRIDEWLSDARMQKNIDNYIMLKCDNKNNVENRKLGYRFFYESLMYIREQFEIIEEMLAKLNDKNTKYITTAKSRLNFLLNEETDIEGRINDVLKGICNIFENDFYESTSLNIYANGNIDDKSLFTPRQNIRKIIVDTDELVEEYLSDIELNELNEKMFKENEFSVYKINEFVMSKLEYSEQIHAKDIEINNFDDIVKLFLVQLYSENPSVEYYVISLEDTFIANGYKLKDYIVERKIYGENIKR